MNDAPALARSTLGIALGAAGTDAALETADVALMRDDLSRLPWLIRHSRRTLNIIRQNIVASLAVKARQHAIWDERDRKLAAARQRRRAQRQVARAAALTVESNAAGAEDRATLGSDPSADSGARTDAPGGREAARHPIIRFGTNALNPSRKVEQPLDPRRDAMCVIGRGRNSNSG